MEHVEVLQRMANESWRGSPEHAALTAAIAALSAPQPPAEAQPVDRARTLDAARIALAQQPSREAAPMSEIKMLPLPRSWDCWIANKMEDYARAVAEHNVAARDAEIEALRAERDLFRDETIELVRQNGEWQARAEQTAAHPAITHCDNCGCDWLDNGLNPAACPYCKPPAAVDEATRRDAERYRWLRAIPESVRADHERNPANGGWDAPFYWPGSAAGEELQGRDLDAAIDAAVQQEACHA